MKEFGIPGGHPKPGVGIGAVVGEISEYENSQGRPLNVVNADIIAENGAGVSIGQFDGSTSEPDERRIRQHLTHVPSVTVDEVILAAMGFVSDDTMFLRSESSGC
jgi:hypothetical protein